MSSIKPVKLRTKSEWTIPTVSHGVVTGIVKATVNPYKRSETGASFQIPVSYHIIKKETVPANPDLGIEEHIKETPVLLMSLKETYSKEKIDKSKKFIFSNEDLIPINTPENERDQIIFEAMSLADVSRPNKEGYLTYNIPTEEWEHDR